MQKCHYVIILAVIGILAACSTANSYSYSYANDGDIALTLKAGTLGVGIEGTKRITENINARVGVNAFEYDYSGTESDIKYDFDLELLSASALIDWHPFNNAFRASAGLFLNDNSLELKAKAAGSYQIGDTTYTAAQVGTLKGELEFDDVSPYIGIGWGNAVGKDKSWTICVDIGVIYQGSPELSLTADGTLSNNAAFQSNLSREKADLEDDLEDFEFYPVISLGVAYKF